jgi:hypothetical protein
MHHKMNLTELKTDAYITVNDKQKIKLPDIQIQVCSGCKAIFIKNPLDTELETK